MALEQLFPILLGFSKATLNFNALLYKKLQKIADLRKW
jgi:hypothetical protein